MAFCSALGGRRLLRRGAFFLNGRLRLLRRCAQTCAAAGIAGDLHIRTPCLPACGLRKFFRLFAICYRDASQQDNERDLAGISYEHGAFAVRLAYSMGCGRGRRSCYSVQPEEGLRPWWLPAIGVMAYGIATSSSKISSCTGGHPAGAGVAWRANAWGGYHLLRTLVLAHRALDDGTGQGLGYACSSRQQVSALPAKTPPKMTVSRSAAPFQHACNVNILSLLPLLPANCICARRVTRLCLPPKTCLHHPRLRAELQRPLHTFSCLLHRRDTCVLAFPLCVPRMFPICCTARLLRCTSL